MKVELTELDSEARVMREDKSLLTPWINNPYIKAATSDNTRRAYRSDIQHFEAWGGSLPATAEGITQYLQAYAPTLNARTLARRITALKHWHSYQGFQDPTQHPAVRKTLAGILRIHGRPKEKAYPLAPEDLVCLVQRLDQEGSLSALRDKALLQIGFFGALRRSELASLQVEQVSWKEEGIELLITSSKTDQTHQGQYCALPHGKGLLCPVKALKEWLETAKIQAGPIFREIKKGERLQAKAICPISVNHILKRRARECGLPFAEQLSGHSLRRGLATSASGAGANLVAIMRQGRWKQVATVMEYIEARERFSENVALKILEALEK